MISAIWGSMGHDDTGILLQERRAGDRQREGRECEKMSSMRGKVEEERRVEERCAVEQTLGRGSELRELHLPLLAAGGAAAGSGGPLWLWSV